MLSVTCSTAVNTSYVAHHFSRDNIDYTAKLCEDAGYSDKMSMPTGD